MVEDGGGEEVVEGAALVVVGDEQHLGPAARALDVRRDEAEDVVMSHQHLGSRSIVIVTLYRVSQKKVGSQKTSNCSNSLNFEAKIK